MAYLHNSIQELEQLSLAAADHFGLRADYVAKDYFIFIALKEISQLNDAVVFKGGTSLSKGFDAIHRFSEDIDLGMEVEHATEGMRKRMKSCVTEAVIILGLTIENLGDTRSKREFNKFIIPLPTTQKISPIFSHQQKLIVETAVMTPAYPTVKKEIDCYIFRFLESRCMNELIEEYHLAPFPIACNSLERTFCDKAFALCDYYLDGSITKRQSRHIYDLSKLLNHVTLGDSLAELMRKVRIQRLGVPRCHSAQPGVSVASVLREIVASDAFRNDYVNVTEYLLFETAPYDSIIPSLSTIAAFLESNAI